jgi:DNA adenine methylase
MAKTPALHSYFGGKNRFESYIKPCVPSNYKIYLEPFAGSFGVYFFLDMPKNSKVIYNDINRDQTNLVACSKDYDNFYEYLKTELETPGSVLYCKETDEALIKSHYKELYYSLKNSNFRNETFNIPDMKRASTYAFLLTSAFSSCSYTAAGFSGFKLKTFLRKLQNVELQKKLANINIFETLSFDEVIKKYDSPDTFIYLDPPYNSVEKKGSDDTRSGWYGTKDEFGQKEHLQLLELLKTLKSKWMLSYYYFPALEALLPKDEYTWLERDFFRSSASFSENKSTKGTELLILNYDPNLITNVTPTSEKLVDEIEEANGGAFIVANEDKEEILKDFASKISQKDIDPEIAEVLNSPGFFNKLLETEKKIEKKEDEDDFWDS